MIYKKLIYFLFFVLFSVSSFASNFEVTPIILNFKGIEVNENITVAFADFGSILISRDNDQNWEQKRIFTGGEIINIILDDEKMIAFNNRGEIASSSDAGSTWQINKKLEDSVLSVVKYPNGYFIRMRHKLTTLSNDFNETNEFLIESKHLNKITTYYTPTYTKSILYANNELIAEFDSLTFIRFNLNLIPIDTIKFLDSINLGNYFGSGYRIFFDLNYIYFKYLYKENSSKSAIFRTQDFKTIEKFAEAQSVEDYYNIYQGKYYSLSLQFNQNGIIDTTKLSSRNIGLYFKESKIANDKQYIVGDTKIFEILDLKDSSLKVISDYSGLTVQYTPDKINDGSYLFYSSVSAIYKTDNDGITILPTIDRTDPKFQKLFYNYKIHYHYYDSVIKILYLLVDPYTTNEVVLLKSSDYGRTFDSVHTSSRWRTNQPFYRNALLNYNIQKRGNEFVFSDFHNPGLSGVIYSGITTISENGDLVYYLMDSNLVFTNVYSKDTNTYLVHNVNTLDSTSEINFTTNGGKNWELIHKYPINETIGDIFDIEVKGKEYWAITHFDFTKEPLPAGKYLDVVDKTNNSFHRIASWYPPSDNDTAFGMYGLSITGDSGKVYISFQDTLFVTDDLLNKDNWNYYIIPNNGRVVVPFKKFGDKFFGRYVDNDNPYGFETHWIKPIDTLISDLKEINRNIAANKHFVLFPNPASDFIYIQTNQHFFEISIYNTLGIKVLSADNQKSVDISNLPQGIYICNIYSGSKIETQKFVIIR